MTYAVNEIFLTLQGEGAHAGRTAVFCRFAGCNLWSGRESDRDRSVCRFCDTDFVGLGGTLGGRYTTAEELADTILRVWGDDPCSRFVVLTGGEPLLQVDLALIAELHRRTFWIALETNGTIHAPPGIDWICVSPKSNSQVVITAGDELKFAFPQDDLTPAAFASSEFSSFRLQPIDGPNQAYNTEQAIAYCLAHRQWRLSIQTHKMLGLR